MRGAEIECEARGFTLAEVFVHQYVLTQGHETAPDGWVSEAGLQGWRLLRCPKLSTHLISDADGVPVGWLLGVAVDQTGDVIGDEPVRLGVRYNGTNFWSSLEDWVFGLAGKYLAIVVTPSEARVYFDPVVDLPAVFNAKERILAASPLLALRRPMLPNPSIDREDIQKNGGNYGLQMTCDPDVKRVLANHYLSLGDFSLHRYWPTGASGVGTDATDLVAVALQISQRLRRVGRALITARSCAMPISGGADSRLLAYAIGGDLGHSAFCFAHCDNWITQLDAYIGRDVAHDLGQQFLVIDGRAALDHGAVTRRTVRQAKRKFALRTGFQASPRLPQLASAELLPRSELLLRGNILDMTRANQWQVSPGGFDPDHGLSRLAIGGDPEGQHKKSRRRAYLRWHSTLPAVARNRAFDWAFVEQLLPNTLGARLMGYGGALYVNPMNDRATIAACLRVPPEIRRRGMLIEALLRAVSAPPIPFVKGIRQNQRLKSAAVALFDAGEPTQWFAPARH